MRICADCGGELRSRNPIARRCYQCSLCKNCGMKNPTKRQRMTFCSHRCAGRWNASNNPLAQAGLARRSKAMVSQLSGTEQAPNIKARLPKACELCGFSRCINYAHIVDRAIGGPAAVFNLLALCPNCHWLFDHNRLTAEEAHAIALLIVARRAVA